MRYVVKSSWFPGDYGADKQDVAEFDSLSWSLEFIKAVKPPEECEWYLEDGTTKNCLAFTQGAGEKINVKEKDGWKVLTKKLC